MLLQSAYKLPLFTIPNYLRNSKFHVNNCDRDICCFFCSKFRISNCCMIFYSFQNPNLELRLSEVNSNIFDLFRIPNLELMRSEYEDGEKYRCLGYLCSKFQITFSTLKANFLQKLHFSDKATHFLFSFGQFQIFTIC